jgi:hypothetical protein
MIVQRGVRARILIPEPTGSFGQWRGVRTAICYVRGDIVANSPPGTLYQSRNGIVDGTTSTWICRLLKKEETASRERFMFAVGPTTTRSMKSQRPARGGHDGLCGVGIMRVPSRYGDGNIWTQC